MKIPELGYTISVIATVRPAILTATSGYNKKSPLVCLTVVTPAKACIVIVVLQTTYHTNSMGKVM